MKPSSKSLFLRFLLALLAGWLAPHSLPAQSPLPDYSLQPSQIAIVYRKESDESKKLAMSYAQKRNVPLDNLVGLSLPEEETISREDYDNQLREPLIAHFDEKGWWQRKKDVNETLVPVQARIRCILLIKGVPLRIARSSEQKENKPEQLKQDEASVDSELVYFGLTPAPISGPLNNPYFQKETGALDTRLGPIFLTCRLDAASFKTCERVLTDSLATEKTGLWGFAYLDHALKGKNFEIGDDWLREIGLKNFEVGIPTITQRYRDTYPTNYPMGQAAYYYGWYTGKANGPFLNPKMKLQPGAIAVHLHSFSATSLRHPKKRWVAPLLEKGAAASLGNVFEPYLTPTHHFNIFHDRLLKGYSLVEAAHMALPVHSWQSIVVGDPLYRPGLAYQIKSKNLPEDHRDFRAFRLGIEQWAGQPDTLVTKLRSAAARMGSGVIYEAMGLRLLEENKTEEAKAFFNSASKNYLGAPDKLRQSLHLIDIARQQGNKTLALELIDEAKERFGNIPETKSLVGLRNILNPPPPPPAE